MIFDVEIVRAVMGLKVAPLEMSLPGDAEAVKLKEESRLWSMSQGKTTGGA